MKAAPALCCVLALLANSAWAEGAQSPLPYDCNPRSGAMVIGQAQPQPDFMRAKLDWIALLKVGPRKNQWGDPLRSGSRTASKTCGPITIRYSSGFLNTNPQGELGALDFPVIEIRHGQRLLLEATALEQCDVRTARYEYFGACPARWASRIEVVPVAAGFQVRVLRNYLDAEFNEAERTDVYP